MTKGSSGRRGFAQIGREKIPKFAQWSGHMVDVGQKANSRVRAPPTMVLCVHVQTCQDTWCATSKTSTSATLFIPWGIMIRWQQIKELSEDKTNTFWSCADISLNHGVFQYSTSSENIDLNEDLWFSPSLKQFSDVGGTEAEIILKLEIWIIDVVWLFGSKRKYH